MIFQPEVDLARGWNGIRGGGQTFPLYTHIFLRVRPPGFLTSYIHTAVVAVKNKYIYDNDHVMRIS